MISIPRESYVIRAFSASLLLAVLIIMLAGGLVHVFRYGSPLPVPLILAVAAVAFVLSASFFEKYEVGSIVWSMLVSVVATAMITTISGGMLYFATMNELGLEDVISSLALSMIVSMLLLSYLKRSLAQIESY